MIERLFRSSSSLPPDVAMLGTGVPQCHRCARPSPPHGSAGRDADPRPSPTWRAFDSTGGFRLRRSFTAKGLEAALVKIQGLDLGEKTIATSILWPFGGQEVGRRGDVELPSELIRLSHDEGQL